MKTIMKVKNLTVSFPSQSGNVQVIRNISFEIKEGKTLAIVGESGCGKTITAKELMGLNVNSNTDKMNESISFNGKELSKLSQKEWNSYRGKNISMIFQDAFISLNPTLRIGKQIMEGMKNHSNYSKIERYNQAIKILRLVSIPNPENCMKMYPYELSGGMRQRVMIASALVMHPQILIADEPTTALDVTIQAQIIDLLKKIQQKYNMAIVLITHDLGLVADIADDILVMYAGKIVEKGTSEDIFFQPKHPYTIGLLNAVPSIISDKSTELVTIDGNVPDMNNLPKGCSFYNRCKYAMEICKDQLPSEYSINSSHTVCCWLRNIENPNL